jgi:ribosome biogenesis protein NSA2
MIKQKRKEKAGKWTVPLPKVRGMDEAEVFKVARYFKNLIKDPVNVNRNHGNVS